MQQSKQSLSSESRPWGREVTTLGNERRRGRLLCANKTRLSSTLEPARPLNELASSFVDLTAGLYTHSHTHIPQSLYLELYEQTFTFDTWQTSPHAHILFQAMYGLYTVCEVEINVTVKMFISFLLNVCQGLGCRWQFPFICSCWWGVGRGSVFIGLHLDRTDLT